MNKRTIYTIALSAMAVAVSLYHLLPAHASEIQAAAANDQATGSRECVRAVYSTFNEENDSNDIYLSDLDGTRATHVINIPNANGNKIYYISLSPDGSRIMFLFKTPPYPDEEIYVLNSDGTGLRQLTDNGYYEKSASFSADGTKIVFLSDRVATSGFARDKVYLINTDGTDERRLTDDQAINSDWTGDEDSEPKFSPDGLRVVFTSVQLSRGAEEIYSVNLDGSGFRNLTNAGTSENSGASVSPDGTRIVFKSNRVPGDGTELYVMNADGTAPSRLTESEGQNTGPRFTPDGTKIVYTNVTDGVGRLMAISPDGTGNITLSDDPNFFGFQGFLSNGSRIAFTKDENGLFPTYSVDIDGSNVRRISILNYNGFALTDTDRDGIADGCDNCPAVENGPRVLFESNRDGDYEIYSMRVDGLGVEQITENTAADRSASFNAEGSKIVYISTRDTSTGEIYTMNPDGTGRVRLTTNTIGEGGPVFSPDGTKIMYTSNASGNLDVWVMNADGTGAANLTNNPRSDTQGSFSRDGSKIAFVSDRDAVQWVSEVYVMNADGSAQTRVTTHGLSGYGYSSTPNFSPDGGRIAYSMAPPGSGDLSEIYLINVNGTGRTQLTDSDSQDFTDSPLFDDDGDTIFFKSEPGPTQPGVQRAELYSMNVDGTGWTRLTTNTSTDRAPSFWAGQRDADNDGVGDTCDLPGSDGDGDGVNDGADNCPITPNPDQLDADGDGQGDACDNDDDNDADLDGQDNCPLTFNPDQSDANNNGIGDACELPGTDGDGDGIGDEVDNCPLAANPDQADTDSDGQGDACDTDDDNDGDLDGADNCPLAPNPDQADNDGDALGNVCDPDDDNDGAMDGADNCPLAANPGQADLNGNGIGDACDIVLPTLSIGDAAAVEGQRNKKNFLFTVTLSSPQSQPVTVAYATANGTATAASDYTAASGMLNFPAGSTTATMNVSVIGDKTPEEDEIFAVNLSSPVNALLGDGTGTGTIQNDDPFTADVRVVKTATAGTYMAGSVINYTIVVTNNGPSPAHSVVMTDTLPSTLTFVSCSSTVGTCTPGGAGASVFIGTLTPDGSATVTLSAQINNGVPGRTKVVNTASVSAAIVDPSTRNNTSSASVTTARQ